MHKALLTGASRGIGKAIKELFEEYGIKVIAPIRAELDLNSNDSIKNYILKTLKREDFYSGVGEMAKLHLMNGEDATKNFVKDLSLIDKLDETILLKYTQNCLKIKKSYIENDEFDTGKRNMLNYGHCFGHAIESSTNFEISHGQAVVLGMILANKEAKNVEFYQKK